MANAVMYIFVSEGSGMSTGKIASQAAHAAVEAYRISPQALLNEWYKGQHYTKLVMGAKNAMHLYQIERYLNDRGFKTAMIIDEGMTEVEAHTATALGVQVVDKDDPHTLATFSTFSLFSDKVKVTLEFNR